ncbi:hypothetical protein [Streptomyces sp. NPDC059850]|uniref:hypothetical protein n=1 Tax=Streptomyces sp. NPDC059850 TaxID=3346970 RepID=UPI00365B0C28
MARMVVFRRRCHVELTAPVREVPLPDADSARPPCTLPEDEECPPRMRPGTFACDPPEAGEQHPAARANLNGIVLAKADVHGTELTSLLGRRNGCCGLDGCDGPNLVCLVCTAEVATERSDCWTPNRSRSSPTR